jgi:putative nucleotidyltransferase-like protein
MAVSSDAALWQTVDGMLARADVGGILAHELAPLAAYRLRSLGLPVPGEFLPEEQITRTAVMTSIPLLRRVRDLADGPLVLAKGAEVAWLYPGRARSFNDVDILAVESGALHASLRAEGFVEVRDADDFWDYSRGENRHLQPLQAPRLWLRVEIHTQPIVPATVQPPALAEVVEAAVPSALGMEGISAPHPVHHALMLAGHAWEDRRPLHVLRDLIDVAAVAQHASESELARTADSWGIGKIWRATYGATAALFGDGRPTAALRLFGRHLATVRESSVLDNHLQRWLYPFWELPFHQALATIPGTLRQELLPEPGESWRHKIQRVKQALVHPERSMSTHTESWRQEAADDIDSPNGHNRNPTVE